MGEKWIFAPPMTLGYLAHQRWCFLSIPRVSYKEGGGVSTLSWVVKIKSGSVKQPVIGSQLFKDSVTEFTISCLCECVLSLFLS